MSYRVEWLGHIMGHLGHFAVAPVFAQPDARQSVDIESLLAWVYQRQRAHVVIGRVSAEDGKWLGGGGAVDSIVRCHRLAQTGGRVDGGGPSANHLHVDAETVAELVAREAADAELMVRHASTLSRPDWMPGARPRWEAVRDERGRPSLEYPAGDTHRNYGWCRVHLALSSAQIARARDVYAAWHASLVHLAALPRMRRLVEWRVTGPRAPAAPWLADPMNSA